MSVKDEVSWISAQKVGVEPNLPFWRHWYAMETNKWAHAKSVSTTLIASTPLENLPVFQNEDLSANASYIEEFTKIFKKCR